MECVRLAIDERLALTILLQLFFTGCISLNLFIALVVVVGLLFSAAVMVIIKKKIHSSVFLKCLIILVFV